MPVRIRLSRRGKKKKPFYWVVAAHAESPRDGRFLEKLGTYNPLVDPAEVVLDMDRLNLWIARGAQLSDTVMSLVKRYKRNITGTEEVKAS